MLVYVCSVYLASCLCASQRTTCWSQFSLVIMWIPVIRNWSQILTCMANAFLIKPPPWLDFMFCFVFETRFHSLTLAALATPCSSRWPHNWRNLPASASQVLELYRKGPRYGISFYVWLQVPIYSPRDIIIFLSTLGLLLAIHRAFLGLKLGSIFPPRFLSALQREAGPRHVRHA